MINFVKDISDAINKDTAILRFKDNYQVDPKQYPELEELGQVFIVGDDYSKLYIRTKLNKAELIAGFGEITGLEPEQFDVQMPSWWTVAQQ